MRKLHGKCLLVDLQEESWEGEVINKYGRWGRGIVRGGGDDLLKYCLARGDKYKCGIYLQEEKADQAQGGSKGGGLEIAI